jgi:nucleoside-diphosphate-sugar epimerase
MSTTAVFTSLNSSSKLVRLEAEKIISNSNVVYTILRPTMIYGSYRDRNMCRLIKYLRRWPIIPIFGNGEYLQQPVYVKDVALAITQALESERTIRKSYNISGGDALTFNQVIDTICNILNRRVWKIYLSPSPIVALTRSAEKIGLRLPIKAEQIQRLNEDKAFDFAEAAHDFGYNPCSFADGIRAEIQEMAING